MRHAFLLAAMVQILLLQSCQEEDHGQPQTLDGTWVEISTLSDTIVFRPDLSKKFFEFNRGRELRNGHLLPKYGAGLYEFNIQGDSISLYNMFSSCYCFKSYYFSLDRHLRVGQFYEDKSTEKVLTFIRVR